MKLKTSEFQSLLSDGLNEIAALLRSTSMS